MLGGCWKKSISYYFLLGGQYLLQQTPGHVTPLRRKAKHQKEVKPQIKIDLAVRGPYK